MNTTITTQPQTLPKLVKGQSTYKLIVPQNVEEKIRYLIRKFPSTEWSGVLFFSHEGSFENNDLVITCADFYPMDLGTSGWTEFQMSEEVAAYMAQNIELFDCDTGLIHSHHALGAFFSGQDNLMLQQEGNDTNCFVSLVVDTKGTYVARITRKIQSKSEVIVKPLGTSYEFFGNGSKTISNDSTELTKIVDKEYIEYFDLQVERHEVPNTLSYLDTRFAEIELKKKDVAKTSVVSQQTSLDFKDTPKQNATETETEYDWTPDPKKIHEAVVHIVILNLILNPKNFNFKHWITRHMFNVYQRIFGKPATVDSLPNAFCEWRDFIIQFTLDHYDEPGIPSYMYDEYDIFTSIVAQSIIDELSEYVDDNPYIQHYINTLYQYIV